MVPPIDNKVIIFCTGAAGLFLPPTAAFCYLWLFSLPSGRRGWGCWGISESSLSRYYPTRTDAKGKALKSHKSFCSFLCEYIKRIWKRMRNITPTAKRNSYRVARLVGPATQGSVQRPQPWAGESQLCQSCRGCVPSYDVVKPQPGFPLGRDEEGFISCGFLSPTPYTLLYI